MIINNNPKFKHLFVGNSYGDVLHLHSAQVRILRQQGHLPFKWRSVYEWRHCSMLAQLYFRFIVVIDHRTPNEEYPTSCSSQKVFAKHISAGLEILRKFFLAWSFFAFWETPFCIISLFCNNLWEWLIAN